MRAGAPAQIHLCHSPSLARIGAAKQKGSGGPPVPPIVVDSPRRA
jgi:hypothetical protein